MISGKKILQIELHPVVHPALHRSPSTSLQDRLSQRLALLRQISILLSPPSHLAMFVNTPPSTTQFLHRRGQCRTMLGILHIELTSPTDRQTFQAPLLTGIAGIVSIRRHKVQPRHIVILCDRGCKKMLLSREGSRTFKFRRAYFPISLLKTALILQCHPMPNDLDLSIKRKPPT